MNRKRIWLIALCAAVILGGCGAPRAGADQNSSESGQSARQLVRLLSGEADAPSAETVSDVPEYCGNAFVVVGDGQPDFTEEEKQTTEAFEEYEELDELGRCGEAYANICPEIMPTEKRGKIGQVKPSGWHTVKYNDLIDGNYLYNRCHLIGYQLAGENANEKNLITGTRYLNVEGMLPFEDLVDDYVDETGNHVLYRVTPVFEGDNLVASGVEMEAWSVEDDGEGVCFHVYCYNVQPGIEIRYEDGVSSEAEEGSVTEDTAESEEEAGSAGSDNAQTETYVLNKNTKKIHLPSCPSVDDMKDHNKETYTGTIAELREIGYTPCGNCLKNKK